MTRWRQVDEAEVRWLADLDPGAVAGFDPDRGGRRLWILNAMYERESATGDETYDERHRRLVQEDVTEDWSRLPPVLVGGGGDAETGPGLRVPGGGLGWDEEPGPGWRRLRWRELAARTGDPIVPVHLPARYRLPSFQTFPSVKRDGSWPTSIAPPTEGSLDVTSHRRLMAILRRLSGDDARVFAHWALCTTLDLDFHRLLVMEGRLGDADELETLRSHSPSNLWPPDRSWTIYTDWDLWGTKVIGPPDLIAEIEADEFLETTWLPLE